MTMTDGRYRIAEVAERTGFSTPTLRYYEDIGLLPPAERTAAGYRVYDDRSVERLRFIARAKRLGCTLQEITDLAEAWDSNECAPIKHRLRAAVAGKLAETEARIAELTALAGELRTTAEMLASAPLDGPCDDTCGCIRGPTAAVCTITPAEIPERFALLERMRSAATGVDRTCTGLLLHFADDPAVRADLANFAVDEKRCCQFWAFDIVDEPDGVALRWDGPPAVDDLLDRLHTYFTTDDPVSVLDGLL